ncbi:DUF6443 domain-containing protein [Chitinophaga pinensis]|uniref:YD repeat protein n=1 Tax=Chitinophaga pinensis (strain ATCC 43595 / DSM 2588 / LMG 13176 / NBRC 15968 / NCIMB 11800 / UQM 2034) TaxID=485918 RepID=A0A979GBP7_CHIPD|nr:DUF6443 domain-containing protein [Chitinophaga pinensis]ACU64500.1 YD repeat protein [Chitinophaga pinensis DSM 2588]
MKSSAYFFIASLTVLSILGSSTVSAQNKPQGTLGTATPVIQPAAYTNPKLNYVRTWEPSAPLKDTVAVASSTRILREVKQTTQYSDGLGRPVQIVSKASTPNGRDMVSMNVFDPYGREEYTYLPYVHQASSDGKFKVDPFSAQSTFYQNAIFNPGMVGESIFYSKTEFESSPLNRTIKKYAPGNSWSTHPVENLYQVNDAKDSVRIWTIGGGLPVSTAIYGAGQLAKHIVIDENANQSIVYTDKDDKVILKKVQIGNAPATGYYGWLCTYNVYDDLGNLRYVIPPLGVEAIKSNWILTAAVDTGLCFQYQYDTRQRVIMKRTPGSGRTLMVYDKRDRLVFTQDSIQRAKSPAEWMVTFYDELNRPVMTGLYRKTISADSLQKSMNAASVSQSISYIAPANADLAVYEYDSSPLYTATNSVSLLDGFDSGTGGEFVAEISTALAGDTITVVANNPLPNIPASALTPLTYNFYDNYNYKDKLAFVGPDTNKLQAADTLYPERRPIADNVNGLLTGTKIRVLGTEKWLTTTTYYNDKGRIIQVVSENNLGGKDVTSSLYSFKGSVLATYIRHQNPKSPTAQTTVLTTLTYDPMGRLLTIRKRLNDDVSQERIILSNSYDEIGQLRLKRLAVTSSGSMLDSLNYTYNSRGWLQGINKNFLNSGNVASNWFGLELSYDYGFKVNQYNGNIAGVKWKTRSDSAWTYGYSYDKNNQLIAADFSQRNGNSWVLGTKDFSVSNLSYDANGNIKTMLQKGMIGTTSRTIDSLVYAYPSNSNRLLSVTDIDSSITRPARLGDFIDGNTTTKDYFYDANGNMIADLNKRISSITYNHLNLPVSVTITGKGTITYQYDAVGNKLSKTVVDNTGSSTKTVVTDYAGIFIYQKDSLELISHEEGRIRPVYKTAAPIAYVYDYFEKDHLGNVRTVLTDQTDFTMYAATMETVAATTETALFGNIEETRAEKPSGYPQDDAAVQNKYVAKLNAKNGGRKIGPSLVLRVMAGDTVKIGAKAFYKSQEPQDNNRNVPLEDMLASLVQVFGSISDEGSTHLSSVATNATPFNSDFYNNHYQRLKEKENNIQSFYRPKSYLNFVLFDDDFKMVEKNSGVRQVKENPDELQNISVDRMAIEKSGFLYVYTSNESQQDVFFDNIVVALNSGPLLEETHYYPYGMVMAGISSNALKGANYQENRIKYNGKEIHNNEFSDGSGLEWEDYGARMYDVQLGRWFVPDPLVDRFANESPFVYGGNNPVLNIDVAGGFKFPKPKAGQKTHDYERTYPKFTQYLKTGISNLLKSQELVDAYAKFGYLSLADLQNDFTWGKGATIKIVPYPGGTYEDEASRYARGYTHDDDRGETIEIREELVAMFEKAPPEEQEALFYWVIRTLLHEEVHRGNLKNGTNGGEPGIDFDDWVWAPIKDGYRAPDPVTPGFGDTNPREKMIKYANDVIADKKQTEEGKKMLPNILDAQTAETIKSYMDRNPNIKLEVKTTLP